MDIEWEKTFRQAGVLPVEGDYVVIIDDVTRFEVSSGVEYRSWKALFGAVRGELREQYIRALGRRSLRFTGLRNVFVRTGLVQEYIVVVNDGVYRFPWTGKRDTFSKAVKCALENGVVYEHELSNPR